MARKTLLNKMYDNNKYNILYTHYKILSISIFKWSNLPPGLNSEYIENQLFKCGCLGFYDNKNYGLICLPCSETGQKNVYNEPTEYVLTGHGMSETVKAEDVILIKNNSLKVPGFLLLDYFVNQIYEIDRTIERNIKQLKYPFLIGTTKENELSMKNIEKKISDGDLSIFVDKELNESGNLGISCFNTNVPFLIDKLQSQRIEVEKMILSTIGINCTSEKRERLVTDEVNANNFYIVMNLESMYATRLRACEEINKIFNLNIKVEKMIDILEIPSNMEG